MSAFLIPKMGKTGILYPFFLYKNLLFLLSDFSLEPLHLQRFTVILSIVFTCP